MINEIKNGIKNKLEEIDEIYGISNYVKKIDGYPFGFLKYEGSDTQFLESRGILVNHNFKFSIILNYKNEEESELKTEILVDKILEKIYEDITLNNLIQFLEIRNVETVLDEENGKNKIIIFNISTTLINNF